MLHKHSSVLRLLTAGLAIAAIAPATVAAQPIDGQAVAAGGGPGVTRQILSTPDQADPRQRRQARSPWHAVHRAGEHHAAVAAQPAAAAARQACDRGEAGRRRRPRYGDLDRHRWRRAARDRRPWPGGPQAPGRHATASAGIRGVSAGSAAASSTPCGPHRTSAAAMTRAALLCQSGTRRGRRHTRASWAASTVAPGPIVKHASK